MVDFKPVLTGAAGQGIQMVEDSYRGLRRALGSL